MRSRYTYQQATCNMCTSSSYTTKSTGAVTKRTPPVTFAFNSPQRELTFEATSDLSEANTRSTWNAFQHYKSGSTFNMLTGTPIASSQLTADYTWFDRVTCIPCVEFAARASSAIGPVERPIAGLPLLYNPTTSGFVPDPDGLTTLKANALAVLLPGIKPELSLINSLVELKDFRTLGRTVRRVTNMSKTGKSPLKWTLRRILGGASDGYLQAEFNVMPLLSDIAGIRNALKNTQRRAQKLLEEEKKVLTRHYYASVRPPNIPTPAWVGGSNAYAALARDCSSSAYDGRLQGLWYVMRDVRVPTSQFHVEIQYTYYYSAFQRENAQMLALMDALGVNLNPSIIWNAIPWSFVVDWVLGVSRWLDQFKVQNMEPVTVIHKALWSYEVYRTVTVDSIVNWNVANISQSRVRSTSFAEHAYKRQPFSVSSADITLSGVSLKEMFLAGALAVSRKTRNA